MIAQIRVLTKKDHDTYSQAIQQEIKNTFGINTEIRAIKIYRLQGVDQQVAENFAKNILVDSISQEYIINQPIEFQNSKKIEIAKKPGVMNPEVATIFKAANELKINDLSAADTSWEYHFYGDITDEQIKLICNRLLLNKTIEQVVIHEPETLIIDDKSGSISKIALRSMTEQELLTFAKSNCLHLNLQEMKTIQNYFVQINRDPYDAELETIAQTWSEHCCHKTFKANLVVNGINKKSLFTRLKEEAKKYSQDVVSAFIDNSGAFKFYDGYAILGKVETHNSPSAIEPYGGAATGSGGVFRDIMGTGKGAKVIASTDMFCFAPPDLPSEQLPPGCLAPNYLLRKVVAGVRDYGNRMGIPTNNGSVHFHEDFRAKPTVIVGAYGIAPENKCAKGTPQAGDLIFVIGGRTGRDGIHGATFSSGQMTASTISTNANAVQIGNAIEEKRMADALIVARDADLIRAITDCGAGGFSSAVGEMASEIGAVIQLEKTPLKYAGLNPWEIWISESQERMICAIAPEHAQQFKNICADCNVEATQIGYFSNNKKLVVTYDENILCDLEMEFLHNGMPEQILIANYVQKNFKEIADIPVPHPTGCQNWLEIYCKVLSHWNICSKEPIIRQYDHTVQGTNALPPFGGVEQHGPNDAAILTPILGKPYGVVISHGMNPVLNRIDPYYGSWWAITEALSNLVAVGGDISQTYLIDNFIWPCPDEYYLGQLDASLDACVDAMKTFKIPFISGKDSLSSTYQYPTGEKLQIPPVLCISAFGKIPDVQKTVSADFKKEDSLIVLIGELDFNALGGSTYLNIVQKESYENYKIPHVKCEQLPTIFSTVHSLINQGIIKACHDISEGGIAVAIAEMCFGGQLGAQIELQDQRPDFFLFNETAGCFLIEIDPINMSNELFEKVPHYILGKTTQEKNITVYQNDKLLFEASLEYLQNAWQRPMKEIFGK
ncbi:phosphoribosylformylglycinamidine synthase subunit PurL [Candidatus Dependentiae bacterium]|nr:phosphoribosylformylglycinamidine synthase subunit PurL [Candidatus Dependentiae bacterium]